MKKYLLFSTNCKCAIDNVSFCISYETESQLSRLRDVCTYSFMTLSPIGKPEGGAITFEEAVEKIKSVVLHKEVYKPVRTDTKVVGLPKFAVVSGQADGMPIIDILTAFSEECTILRGEHKMVQALMDIFPNNLGYYKNRARFAVHNWSKTTQARKYEYKYTVCDSRLIEVCDVYTIVLEEL